jgi:hypothetical protein
MESRLGDRIRSPSDALESEGQSPVSTGTISTQLTASKKQLFLHIVDFPLFVERGIPFFMFVGLVWPAVEDGEVLRIETRYPTNVFSASCASVVSSR